MSDITMLNEPKILARVIAPEAPTLHCIAARL